MKIKTKKSFAPTIYLCYNEKGVKLEGVING